MTGLIIFADMDEKIIEEIKRRAVVFADDNFHPPDAYTYNAIETAMLIGAGIVFEKQAEEIERPDFEKL